MATQYDVVWFWKDGRWQGTLDWAPTMRQEIERMGYPARDGRRSIGAPDTPPSDYRDHQ